jgi:hypothetical protein
MFSLVDYFSTPAITLKRANTTVLDLSAEFAYNSFGYRTHEFDSVKEKHVVVAGCSHTEGTGLHLDQTWVKKLEKQLDNQVINLAVGGSNADFVNQNLTLWLQSYTPQLVVAQWPNIYRATHWNNHAAHFTNSVKRDTVYKEKMLQGNEHFLLTWVKNVVYLDSICKLKNIPVIHIYLDTPGVEQKLLEKQGIEMHYDNKLPEKTWHFDSGALDKMHHSEWCHEQWVNRIVSIL